MMVLFPAPLGPNSPRTSPAETKFRVFDLLSDTNAIQTMARLDKETKDTFANAERDVFCCHFPCLVEGKTFSFALVLLRQVAHNHHWFLNRQGQGKNNSTLLLLSENLMIAHLEYKYINKFFKIFLQP